MNINRRLSTDVFLVILINCLVFLLANTDGISLWIIYFVNTAGFLYLLRDFEKNGAVGLVLLIGGLVLYTYPYLGVLIRDEKITPIFYSLFLFILIFMIKLTPKITKIKTNTAHHSWFTFIFIFLVIAFGGLYIWAPIFPAFFAIALIFLDKSCNDTAVSNKYVIYCAGLFFICLLLFKLFFWSGFGRLHFLTYLILPILVLFHRGVITIKKWQIMIIAPLGLVYGSAIRGMDGGIKETFAGDSAYHHLLIMDNLYKDPFQFPLDLESLFNQFLLYFMNWFPRELWDGKPVGIGLWFVDKYLGRAGVSEEHSVSMGFWGEHLYLNPDFWFLSGVLVLFATVLFMKFLHGVTAKSDLIIILFQANLLSLLWGGMASFGSRVWWMVLPVAIYIWVDMIFARFKSKFSV